MPETYDPYAPFGLVDIVVPSGIKQFYQICQRLEPRSRSDNFADSISAKISDPLWMLSRQWQVGEFIGEDAGSPIKTLLQTSRSLITKYKPKEFKENAPVIQFHKNIPLEYIIEKESLKLNFRMSIQIGQQIEFEIGKLGDYIDRLRDKYPLQIPEPCIEVDNESLEFISYFIGKVIDGKKIFEEGNLLSDDPKLLELFPDISQTERNDIKVALARVKNWIHNLYGDQFEVQQKAWNHNRFEYECCVSAPLENGKECILEVSEYSGGNIDWSDFSVIEEGAKLGSLNNTPYQTIDPLKINIPTNISFYGMPNKRWWAFEDSKTDFGSIDVKTTDIGKLLFMEFAFIYGNDWFQIPVPLDIGSLCWVKKLEIVDVFGINHVIDRAGAGEDDWQRWEMFTLSVKNRRDIGNPSLNKYKSADFLFLPPVLSKNEIATDLEEIRFLRDEMANKVWAVEHKFSNLIGFPQQGAEYYRDYYIKINEKKLYIKMDLFLQIFNELWNTIKLKVIGFEDEIKDIDIYNSVKFFFENAKSFVFSSSGIDLAYATINVLKQKFIEFKVIINNLQKETLPLDVNSFLSSIEEKLNDIVSIIDSFRKFNIAKTFELRESCVDNIKGIIKKYEKLLILTEEQKKEIGINNKDICSDKLPGFKLMSSVPEYWIPYISVNTGSDLRAMELVQSNMIRANSDKYELIEPKSQVLKTAQLDGIHKIDEEVISRSGLKVRLHAQRTRWIDGSTLTWFGRESGLGRGEGSSGLRFDYLEDQK